MDGLFRLLDSVHKDTGKPAQAALQRNEFPEDGAYCKERVTQTRFQCHWRAQTLWMGKT
jgi:hypothetical protein